MVIGRLTASAIIRRSLILHAVVTSRQIVERIKLHVYAFRLPCHECYISGNTIYLGANVSNPLATLIGHAEIVLRQIIFCENLAGTS